MWTDSNIRKLEIDVPLAEEQKLSTKNFKTGSCQN